MRSNTIYSMLLIMILSSCSILPHYEEKRYDQKKRIYKNYSSGQIWTAILETIMHMEYTVIEMDKQSGFLHGEGGELGLAWTRRAAVSQKISIIVTEENENITITCQVFTGIKIDTEKEIMKFFDLLSENLKKNPQPK